MKLAYTSIPARLLRDQIVYVFLLAVLLAAVVWPAQFFKINNIFNSCIVSPSSRILADIEEGEGVVVQDLTIEGVDEWRRIASYLEDRKDHLDLYRKQLDL